jgi:hypothetical protein
MARQISMPYQFPPVALLPPAADAAGRTSAYRDLANALKAWVVVHVNQGNAAQVTLSILQGQDVSGTGSKAVGVVPIWLCGATATSDALVVQTAAATFQTSTGTSDKIVIFEITPEMCLDLVNGFHTIAVQTSASNAANITEAELFLWESYQGASAPSTLV